MIDKMKALSTELRQDARGCLDNAARLRDLRRTDLDPSYTNPRWALASRFSHLAAEMLSLAADIEEEVSWLEFDAEIDRRNKG